MSTTAKVPKLPKCDFCSYLAQYDGRIDGRSSWAYMCPTCWIIHGCGELGTGSGQRLEVDPELV